MVGTNTRWVRAFFNVLFNKYWEKAYADAFKRVQDSDIAKDIVQEVFVHLWEKREALNILNLPAYLNVAIRNKVFKQLEKRANHMPFFDVLDNMPSGHSKPDENLLGKELLNFYETLVNSLPDKGQNIFRLHYEEDLPTKEIAVKLVKNFEMAAAQSGKFCTKFPFDDTDIYKTVEGASYALAVHPDPKLMAYVDSMITIVGKAQEPDGYLYTARTIDPLNPHEWSGKERWVLENELSHELYNSGHMFEAAAAHFLATGKRNFLNIALKNADLLVQTFGPGKRHVAPGHEIVEMGLVRL
ncbi:sigma-70 family RNA polymerase sigma factor [Mucilaginibacter psychrotolerans]|uniref:Sigma-70 family RNA polymerase sigma factor n=1 Tax=Mucilaginibacter psychrotolerans TaxID=1524096 RepID=A0A4Y8S5H5_9SPHI|nr:sigma-70 family RNA polymerase sigma factor [Mucilaginibacter psychrotolerans]